MAEGTVATSAVMMAVTREELVAVAPLVMAVAGKQGLSIRLRGDEASCLARTA